MSQFLKKKRFKKHLHSSQKRVITNPATPSPPPTNYLQTQQNVKEAGDKLTNLKKLFNSVLDSMDEESDESNSETKRQNSFLDKIIIPSAIQMFELATKLLNEREGENSDENIQECSERNFVFSECGLSREHIVGNENKDSKKEDWLVEDLIGMVDGAPVVLGKEPSGTAIREGARYNKMNLVSQLQVLTTTGRYIREEDRRPPQEILISNQIQSKLKQSSHHLDTLHLYCEKRLGIDVYRDLEWFNEAQTSDIQHVEYVKDAQNVGDVFQDTLLDDTVLVVFRIQSIRRHHQLRRRYWDIVAAQGTTLTSFCKLINKICKYYKVLNQLGVENIKGGYLFCGNTFYYHEDSISHVQKILALFRAHDNDNFFAQQIKEQVVGDLNVQVSEQPSMVYSHEGEHCEHHIHVLDVRLIDEKDDRRASQYPMVVRQPLGMMRQCEMCGDRKADVMSSLDMLAPHAPFYWCEECYERMHRCRPDFEKRDVLPVVEE